MTWTTKHRNRTAALLASLALVSAGCSDEVTAPQRGARAPVVLGVRDEGLFVSNQVKYRNAGAQPATGRSGNATLEVRALRSKDNSTLLEVTTGALDETAVPPGNLAKLQVKSLNPDDLTEALWTQNYNHREGGGYASYVLETPGRGMPIQVQANITGIDARTDVVTVIETVKFRPDLAPSNLVAPTRARVNTAVAISATVRELNGDVGARANCVLYADGSEIDRVSGMWVDAGGTVSCAFAHVFTTTGTKALRAAVENVVPGDWDDANNSVTGSIEIASVNDFHYYAQAYSDLSPHAYGWDADYYYTSSGVTQFSGNHYAFYGVEQSAYLSAWMPVELSFPLAGVAMAQTTNGAALHAQSFTNVAAGWSYESAVERQACANLPTEQSNGYVWFSICSGRHTYDGVTTVSWTQFGYQRYSGDVTYWSSGYDHWYYATGEQYHYSWNYSSSESNPVVPYGPDYSFSVRIDDDGMSYRTNPMLTFTPYEYHNVRPYGCSFGSGSGYSWRDCWGQYEHRNYIYGSKWGVPGSE